MHLFTAPTFFAGMVLCLSLIMAIGPQNAHVIRMGLLRQHLWLTIGICIATDFALMGIGVGGLGPALWCVGQRLGSPRNAQRLWRALDALVALMMWGTALWLLAGLL